VFGTTSSHLVYNLRKEENLSGTALISDKNNRGGKYVIYVGHRTLQNNPGQAGFVSFLPKWM
jgi:hypothetical protein